MKSLRELRALAGELREKGIIPPYFLQVNKEEIPELEKLSAFVHSREYGPNVGDPPCGLWDVGACEHFQFVVIDRRKGPCDRRVR